jgi:undecaprenyl-diphosphatase
MQIQHTQKKLNIKRFMSDLFLSFILGIIQGLTEFLPISSSAHLLFPSLVFGSNDLGLAFDISVHVGTLLAVIYYFRDDILAMTKSLFQSNSSLAEERGLALLLIIATIPIVLAGFFGSDLINDNRTNISSIAYMNLIFAGFLFIAYFYSSASKTLLELTVVGALFIGLFQVFALLPGASRSGTAMTAALFIGLNLKDASKFAFLLSIPTILGALVFLLIEISTSSYSFNFVSLSIGLITSSIVAFLTIKYFLIFVDRIGMYPFVIYRIILGCILLLVI